jgi:hypothetical protein
MLCVQGKYGSFVVRDYRAFGRMGLILPSPKDFLSDLNKQL